MSTDSTHSTGEANVRKLAELIKDIKFAMLTTADPDGALRSRPMATQSTEFDGELWFFTSDASGKAASIKADQHVNVAYSNPDDNHFVSVTGRASIVKDRNKIKELWNPLLKTWFPDGVDDPQIALIRVSVDSAEYWDSPSSKLVHLYGFAKAMLTGRRPEGGENERMDIANPSIH